MTTINSLRRGSAIITAIGMGIVLMLIIATVQTFSSYRMQTTIQESRKVKALALAEAGLELAIGELFNNSNFETHNLAKDMKWLAPVARKHTLKDVSEHGLKIDSASSGTYSGKLGDGRFMVKVGHIPYKDDSKTKTINESLSFIRVESLGIYDTTIRRVEAVVNRRFPAREFLMFDGGFLSMVYGTTNSSNKNVFSTGHLYGHTGVEIGRILMESHVDKTPGTTQELDDMNAIISGEGGIFIYSPIMASFREKRGVSALSKVIPTNTVFPKNGTYENPADIPFGAYPKELENTAPGFPEEFAPWIKDKKAGMSFQMREPPFDTYKTDAKTAKGMYISESDTSALSVKYRMPTGWTKDNANFLKAVYLDFGSNIRPSKVVMPENGIIFSEKDVVIKGNPPKDISIVSTKNVFVAGDFNQSGDPAPADGSINQIYGMPQDYEPGENALTANDYSKTVKGLLKDDVKSDTYKNHIAANVIAKERIVYDYRSPVDCFENEIYPFMKYKLAEKLADETIAADNCLAINKSGTIVAKATSAASFSKNLDEFFEEFPINTAAQEGLKTELDKMYKNESGKFNFKKFDEASKLVWEQYVKNYESGTAGERGALSAEAKQIENTSAKKPYGVYGLLNGLRVKMGGQTTGANPSSLNDKPGDFLYYPEMTSNAMFISCGKLNNKFYSGPDVMKSFNKIGLGGNTAGNEIGRNHSLTTGFVFRVYGSETNLRLEKVHRIDKNQYIPPTRRKIYDETLPELGLASSKYELASFLVISWKDTMATTEECEAF